MRRFFITSLAALTLLISVSAYVPTAHALVEESVPPDVYTAALGSAASPAQVQAKASYDACMSQSGNTATQCQPVYDQVLSNAADSSGSTPPPDPAAQGSPTDPKLGDTAAGFGTIMTWIVSLFAWLVGVAALTLDYAVYYTVVTMGHYVQSLTAVGTTWRILRDIGNIMLIFGFLAVGVTTILNVNWYGSGRKMLPMMLVAAVFLNFSMFFAEVVIDTGNLFATQFYTQINGGKLPTSDSLSKTTIAGEGISNAIMSQLGLQTIYGDAQKPNAKLFEGNNSWLIGFMAILLFLTAAFVMFSLAFILIARFVALIFIIILSPVGFAGLAVPMLKRRADQWRGALFDQTVTAPILLLMLYIALAVITDANFLTGISGQGSAASNAATGFWSGFATNNFSGFATVLLSFLVAMGLLLAVVIQSKNLSAFAAGGATKLGAKLTGALSFGAISLAGRGTLGAAGYALNSQKMQARVTNNKTAIGRFAARAASFTGRNLENRTFDARNVSALGKLGSALGNAPVVGGSGIGAVFTGGAKVTAAGAIDKTREVYKTYKPFSGEWWRAQEKEYEKAAAAQKRKENISDPNNPDFAKTLKKMSADELAELKGIREATTQFVEALSPAKYAELQKSDKLLQGEKDKLKTAWELQFNDPNDSGRAAATINRFTTEEIASLDSGTLKNPNVIAALGPNELDAIRRKGNLSADDRRAMYAEMTAQAAANPTYKAELDEYFANDQGGTRAKFWNPGGPARAGGGGGGAQGGGNQAPQQPPPAGYQQNPGGVILTPNRPRP